MAFEPQGQVSVLARLADETLQHILDFAMARDSPIYIDDPFRGANCSRINDRDPSPVLESSTGAKDPLFTGHKDGARLHQHAPQSVNSTNRRSRALGKLSFFRAKTIATHAELLARFQRNEFTDIKHRWPNDQALALSYIRDIVIVNAKECASIGFLQLPRVMAAFLCLRRCTLLFGFEGDKDDREWITVAFALGGPVPLQMQELMTGVGKPRYFRLEEALGPGWTWAVHRNNIARYVYPMLAVKAELLRAKEEKEERKIRILSVAYKWYVFGCLTCRFESLPQLCYKVRRGDFVF